MDYKDVTKEQVLKYLKESYKEFDVHRQVENVMPDYLYADWQAEFEEAYDAYQEFGNGEAESHVRMEMEEDILKHFGFREARDVDGISWPKV